MIIKKPKPPMRNNNNNNIIETKKAGSNSMRRMQGRSCSRCHDAKNKRTEKRMEKNEKAGDRDSFFYAYWPECLDKICCFEPALNLLVTLTACRPLQNTKCQSQSEKNFGKFLEVRIFETQRKSEKLTWTLGAMSKEERRHHCTLAEMVYNCYNACIDTPSVC